MIRFSTEDVIPTELIWRYFDSLVNCFFKILPMRENEEASLQVYMESLQAELIGCKGIVNSLNNDARFLTLVSILQYLIDHPECPVKTVKREVFKAIRICNALKKQYGEVTH